MAHRCASPLLLGSSVVAMVQSHPGALETRPHPDRLAELCRPEFSCRGQDGHFLLVIAEKVRGHSRQPTGFKVIQFAIRSASNATLRA